jgi:hypothetical protein
MPSKASFEVGKALAGLPAHFTRNLGLHLYDDVPHALVRAYITLFDNRGRESESLRLGTRGLIFVRSRSADVL